MLKNSAQLKLVDLYWRAANYISVVQMYLKNNLLLESPITVKNLRNGCGGHCGTTPGINFLYAHLNVAIKNNDIENVMLIIGPGHAAAALLSNLYLEGTLQEYYPGLTMDGPGFNNFITMVQSPTGFRSEINPKFPGTIYDGGELGYSLSVAQGAVIDNPDLIAICIIGDGEAETGPLATSWHGAKFINPKQDGMVLPILHLNNYKMASESIYANMTEDDLLSYFSGLGYEAQLIKTNHEEAFDGFNWAFCRIKEIKHGTTEALKQKAPLIIFKSPKGWTGVKKIGHITIEGSPRSHKNPTSLCSSDQELCIVLNGWLMGYKPMEFLDYQKKSINPKIFDILPKKESRLGMCLRANNKKKCKPLSLPNIKNFLISNNSLNVFIEGMEIVGKYIAQVFYLNKDKYNFIVVSPDELTSNRLGGILEITKRRFVHGDSKLSNESSSDGRIFEILSEHCCQGWLQGYLLTGRYGIFPTYEAFAPIVISMLTQFSKFLYQAKKIKWRHEMPSINYLLTSLCWSNTYSHQNPEFVSSVLNKSFSFIRIYFPIDVNSLLVCIEKCLRSKGMVNIITSSKRSLPQWLTEDFVFDCVDRGFIIWSCFEKKDKQPDIIFTATGDLLVNEALNAIKEFEKLLPHLTYRFVPIIELTTIGPETIYPHALREKKFEKIFPLHIPVVFSFHGYVSSIKQLLFDRKGNDRFHILGYSDASDISASTMAKMIANGVSRHQIAITACGLLYQSKKIGLAECNNLSEYFTKKMQNYYDNDKDN